MFVFVTLLAIAACANGANLHGKVKPANRPESFWWDGDCGRSKYPDAGAPRAASTYVVGGIDAWEHEFPWIVSLQSRPAGSHFCGGSLINTNWVLTAAHCVNGDAPTSLQVAAGEHQRSANSDVRQIVNVAEIIVHEAYNARTYDNDVALLRLSSPVSFNADVTAVCQPASTDPSVYYDHQCEIKGWGTLRSGGACCPDTLQWTWVDITNQTECNRNYPGDITAQMICAGVGDYTTKDTCQGDSGGPLTIKNAAGQFELIGVVSWGQGCASGYPGVYANVPVLSSWITANIGA